MAVLEKPRLDAFRSNRFSQFGEDGIIAAIFERLPPRTRICVEFGAWDGFYLSNTAQLFSSAQWRAFLIEGDHDRFQSLVENVAAFDCVCINAWIEPTGPNSLESVLEQHGLRDQPDLVSIDIDGNDYWIVQGLERLRPLVLICEYNPTLPGHLDIYGGIGAPLGCSARALIRLAEAKGYRLIAMTDTNCFFVQEDVYGVFDEFETRPEKLYSGQYLTYVATSYDGQYLIINKGPYGLTSTFGEPIDGADASAVIEPPWAVARVSWWDRARHALRRLAR